MSAEDEVIISKRRLVDIRTMLHDAVELVNDALGYEPSSLVTSESLSARSEPESEPPPTKRQGLLVPAYFNPATKSGAENWAKLATVAKRVPLIVIANVSSGPGSSAKPVYAAAIRSVVEAGGKVLGYVPTGYGTRDAQTVLREIDLWRGLYPTISGIFLDEVSSAAEKLPAYRSYVVQARKEDVAGALIVLNPGQPRFDAKYLGLRADVIVIAEGERTKPNIPAVAALKVTAKGSGVEFACLSHDCSEAQAADVIKTCITSGVLWVFAAEGAESNVWDQLPSYFDGEVAAVAEARP